MLQISPLPYPKSKVGRRENVASIYHVSIIGVRVGVLAITTIKIVSTGKGCGSLFDGRPLRQAHQEVQTLSQEPIGPFSVFLELSAKMKAD